MGMSKYFLPNDYARCDNERCDKRNSCARYLDILPFDGYFYCGFNENDCDFYIEKIFFKPEKKAK